MHPRPLVFNPPAPQFHSVWGSQNTETYVQPPAVMSPVTQYVQVRQFILQILNHNKIYLKVQAHTISRICIEFPVLHYPLVFILPSPVRSAQLQKNVSSLEKLIQ